jgi:uncharacterized protein
MQAPSNGGLAVVTGASSGIGLELGRQFAANGFDLIVAAEDEGIHAAAGRLRVNGGGVEAVQADLATEAGVENLYRRSLQRAGRSRPSPSTRAWGPAGRSPPTRSWRTSFSSST